MLVAITLSQSETSGTTVKQPFNAEVFAIGDTVLPLLPYAMVTFFKVRGSMTDRSQVNNRIYYDLVIIFRPSRAFQDHVMTPFAMLHSFVIEDII